MKALVAIAMSLAATSLAAQGRRTVVPYRYATVEANNATAWPFGLASPMRIQYLYDKRLIQVSAMLIREIAIRGEGNSPRPGKTGVDLEIGMGSSRTSPWKASASFAQNRGPWFRTVFRRKRVNLPPQPNRTPQPFVTRFTLDAPFVHVASRGNLLIEYVVHGQPFGNYSHDTSYSTWPKYRKVGKACGKAGLTVVGGDSFANNPLVLYTVTGPSNGIAVLVFGGRPFVQPPRLPWGGCPLYQHADFAVTIPLDGFGRGQHQFRLSLDWKDIGFYTQALSFDAPVTRLSASASHHLVIGGVDAHTRIYAHSTTATRGSVQIGLGIVSELVY